MDTDTLLPNMIQDIVFFHSKNEKDETLLHSIHNCCLQEILYFIMAIIPGLKTFYLHQNFIKIYPSIFELLGCTSDPSDVDGCLCVLCLPFYLFLFALCAFDIIAFIVAILAILGHSSLSHACVLYHFTYHFVCNRNYSWSMFMVFINT